MVINETCQTSNTKNPGSKKQCTPKAVVTYMLAKNSFSFASLDAIKDEANWQTAKLNKDVIPFYFIEDAPETNNTEDTLYEGRMTTYKTGDGVKGVTYNKILSDCSYSALKSYDGSGEYTRIFRITKNNEVHCEAQSDGTIKGEPMSSYLVGQLIEGTDEKPQNAQVDIKFKSYDKSTIEPNFDILDFEGIYDVTLSAETVSATSIAFKALVGCAGDEPLTTIEDANVELLDGAGASYARTFVAYNAATGVYEITGTGFSNGFVLKLKGPSNDRFVISGITYESNQLTIAGI